jgi:hypothetical protein
MKTIKILIWHQKHGDVYVSARDADEELRAYLYIFSLMDDMGYYSYDDALNEDEAVWYTDAKAGHGEAAKWLIDCRCGYEYERVDVEYATVPEC